MVLIEASKSIEKDALSKRDDRGNSWCAGAGNSLPESAILVLRLEVRKNEEFDEYASPQSGRLSSESLLYHTNDRVSAMMTSPYKALDVI